ncbi:MAG TPA: hypothetical protein VM253_09820 [Candidatus Limnocylindrales bacterium]|jgi:hypothetical protein|nr:hypothetical protein [Candidatus Limnocylindrales bacterium]
MIGPSRVTYEVARSRHDEHVRHAARIRDVQSARREGVLTPNRTAQRRITASRLAAALTALKAALHP